MNTRKSGTLTKKLNKKTNDDNQQRKKDTTRNFERKISNEREAENRRIVCEINERCECHDWFIYRNLKGQLRWLITIYDTRNFITYLEKIFLNILITMSKKNYSKL